jgi:DNA-directed RNA polymerase specialized sigma24 family protein
VTTRKTPVLKDVVPTWEPRAPIYVDTSHGPRLIKQEKGERLNFLYGALVSCRNRKCDGKTLGAAKDALFVEILDYCGAVLRRLSKQRGWHLPGEVAVDSRLDGQDRAPRLDQLLDPDYKQNAAVKILYNLHTFKGINSAKFSTWADKIIQSEIMNAVRKRQRDRGTQLKALKKTNPGTQIQALRSVRRRNGIYFSLTIDSQLYRKQSAEDQRFLELKWGGLSNPIIASRMKWNIRKVYNKNAKFIQLGLFPKKSANLKKQEYNRTARAKLKAKINKRTDLR